MTATAAKADCRVLLYDEVICLPNCLLVSWQTLSAAAPEVSSKVSAGNSKSIISTLQGCQLES